MCNQQKQNFSQWNLLNFRYVLGFTKTPDIGGGGESNSKCSVLYLVAAFQNEKKAEKKILWCGLLNMYLEEKHDVNFKR